MAPATSAIPSQHKALFLTDSSDPLQYTTLPTPQAIPGTAIVRVLAAGIVSYTGSVLDGTRVNYPYPKPFIPGCFAIGRIAAVGADATILHPDDLVFVDFFFHGRDDPDARVLCGIHEGGDDRSRALVQGEWRNGTYCEYAKVPLEACTKLPTEFHWSVPQLLMLGRMLVPFGGLTNDGGLDVRPGETVIVAPATGQFGGAGVEVALAMGARVIAAGRNPDSLKTIGDGLKDAYPGRLHTVLLKGDVESDLAQYLAIAPKGVDCYLDFSPPTAGQSTHIKSGILALAVRGRCCLMGGIKDDILVPHAVIYRRNLTITGKWMYEPNAPSKLLKLVESGALNLGLHDAQSYGLEDWKKAFANAAEKNRWGQQTYFEL